MSDTHCRHGRKWYRCCDQEQEEARMISQPDYLTVERVMDHLQEILSRSVNEELRGAAKDLATIARRAIEEVERLAGTISPDIVERMRELESARDAAIRERDEARTAFYELYKATEHAD